MESHWATVSDMSRLAIAAGATLTTISRLELRSDEDPTTYSVGRENRAAIYSLKQILFASAEGAKLTADVADVPKSLVSQGRRPSLDDQLSSIGVVEQIKPESYELLDFLEQANQTLDDLEKTPLDQLNPAARKFGSAPGLVDT